MLLFLYFKIVSLISVCPMGRNQYVCKLIPFHKNKKYICTIDYIKEPFFQLCHPPKAWRTLQLTRRIIL